LTAALIAYHFTRRQRAPLFFFAVIAQTALCFWASQILPGGLLFWSSVFLAGLLLTLAMIDAQIYRLPDILTLPLGLAGLAVAYSEPGFLFTDHLIGMIGGFIFLWSFAALFKALRGIDALGFGDVKLAAAAGAWLSWQALPGYILLASLLGILFFVVRALMHGRYDPAAPLPFGVPMAMSFWITWLHGPWMPFGY
jgi:leader peptidase (prepilin peptidase) / N-methyltransferase